VIDLNRFDIIREPFPAAAIGLSAPEESKLHAIARALHRFGDLW
jgi:hypothetical protein